MVSPYFFSGNSLLLSYTINLTNNERRFIIKISFSKEFVFELDKVKLYTKKYTIKVKRELGR